MVTRNQRRRMAVERLEDRSTPSIINDFRFNDAPTTGRSVEGKWTLRSDRQQDGQFQGNHDFHGRDGHGPSLCNGPAYTGETGGEGKDHSGSNSSGGWELPYYV